MSSDRAPCAGTETHRSPYRRELQPFPVIGVVQLAMQLIEHPALTSIGWTSRY